MSSRNKIVVVSDRMQKGYRYELVASIGQDFRSDFRPELTPKEMLSLGVFCGKYMTDCKDEFPADWFTRAKLSPERRDCSLNYFGVNPSRRPEGMVPMVLSLLHGSPHARRGRSAD